MSTLSIWWVRRDLRLTDNQTLAAALSAAPAVLPVFILDPLLLASPYTSDKRSAFLFGGLTALDQDLKARGSRLIVRSGAPDVELARLCADYGASSVFAERDYSPYAKNRDTKVAAALPVPLQLTGGVTARPVDAVHKDDRSPFVVYTPFSQRWRAFGPLHRSDIVPAPGQLSTPADVGGDPMPPLPSTPTSPFVAGEAEAKRRLSLFVNGNSAPIYDYANTRNAPAVDGTSQLSPYLRFGMLSARLAALAAYEAAEHALTAGAAKGADTWLAELIWREFYISILDNFPRVRQSSFRPEYNAIAWSNDETQFAAWCAGQTGYPIVDAAMRQLTTIGWMHNRLRMVVASFLVKDLLIDWRWGEKFFMQHLIDGDPAANNGGWQWTAGTGTDAAPYFRVFNPVTQGKKFDPNGVFVRRWLPELKRIPQEHVHEPWQMPRSEQIKAHCAIGADYPNPIVDHDWARNRVLAAFAAVKST